MQTVSDNVVPTSDIQLTEGVDILQHLDSIDLTKIDRSFPVFKSGPCKIRFEGFEGKTNDKKNTFLQVKMVLAQPYSTEPEPGQPSKTYQPGFPIVDSVFMKVTGKYNPAEKLADIQLCATGRQQAGFKFADYIGKEGIIRFSIEDSDEYGRKNRIRYVKKAAEQPAKLA